MDFNFPKKRLPCRHVIITISCELLIFFSYFEKMCRGSARGPRADRGADFQISFARIRAVARPRGPLWMRPETIKHRNPRFLENFSRKFQEFLEFPDFGVPTFFPCFFVEFYRFKKKKPLETCREMGDETRMRLGDGWWDPEGSPRKSATSADPRGIRGSSRGSGKCRGCPIF